ncbi:MAG: DUF4954 family protein [Chitinophagaceae bacterium]|nr:MAG: DUF4954 family protein [Chitinophagaceae bacterium]
MNRIIRTRVEALGYNFISPEYIPAGKDEYYLRNEQAGDISRFRPLTAAEIQALESNGNTSDNWTNVLVSHLFDPALVQQCKFYGLVRIGKMEAVYLQFHDVRLQAGLYSSTIISCDIGDYNVVNNVNYLSHYVLGEEVILVNINEMEVSDHAKFGNGIVKEGEKESVRIWLELCNENAGRSVMPFDGMQTGDAWLWTRYRSDKVLMDKFREFTEKKFDNLRGYYGTVGDRTVIKNTRIVKDVRIGSDGYVKGANKLKNLTINSSAESATQIGEGVELVNGIIGFGCRVFYGVKAVRFILASHSQLKYGARLINSFLGDNSTISCCEVLNSLIFPAHEQHHNNSFLCASAILGQSNVAAGATIGSNHNSRGADGELIAGRGFWPGLCVSLKHNSRFASYTLLAKGDFPAELDVRIPFTLVSNDVSRNRLTMMPAYWFMYNMYALARNAGKYNGRDKRSFRNQYLEYDYLAPDSVNEMLRALDTFREAVGEALSLKAAKKQTALRKKENGTLALDKRKNLDKLEILLTGVEHSTRKVQLVKVTQAYHLFRDYIVFYGISQLLELAEREKPAGFAALLELLGDPQLDEWTNIGSQLMPVAEADTLLSNIREGRINSWDEVHDYYHSCSDHYLLSKARHAIAALLHVQGISIGELTVGLLRQYISSAVSTREYITTAIYESRAKDYKNPFRMMVYNSTEEMETVVGALADNTFILQQQEELFAFRTRTTTLLGLLGPESQPKMSKNKTVSGKIPGGTTVKKTKTR